MAEATFHFKNPHPGGVRGCPSPLPEPLEDAAAFMNDKHLTIEAAGKIINDAIGKLGAGSKHYKVRLREGKRDGHPIKFIMIERGDVQDMINGKTDRVDGWLLIEYD